PATQTAYEHGPGSGEQSAELAQERELGPVAPAEPATSLVAPPSEFALRPPRPASLELAAWPPLPASPWAEPPPLRAVPAAPAEPASSKALPAHAESGSQLKHSRAR